jgi:carboxypeptidase Q
MRKLFFTFSALLFISFISAQEKLDMDMINKIKKEEMDNSNVMDIAHHLTDISGPRLTNSPGFMRAANWAKKELSGWGLVNTQLEPWGEFGKGWEQEKCYVAIVKV